MTIKVKNIDTSTIDGKIAVMQAYKNGAKIAMRARRHYPKVWVSAGGQPAWSWYGYDYAVIEEPQEMWVVQELYDGEVVSTFVRDTKEQAEAWAASHRSSQKGVAYRVVKFVEVQE